MHKIEHIIAPNISEADIDQIASLCFLVFSDPASDENALRESMRKSWMGYSGPPENAGHAFVARHDGRIVANATIFPRRILTPRGMEFVAMLAMVMSHPSCRGMGYGKAVVEAGLSQVTMGHYSFVILQTRAARGLYEKLGARLISNRIVNSKNPDAPEANPCWDPYIMVYPDQKNWKDGVIDLLGPAV